MIVDALVVICLVYALFKGYTRGLVVAVFSVLAFIVGLTAAVKLSAIVAGWLSTNSKLAQQWLPTISFAVIFLVTVLLVRMGAKLVEKSVKIAMLGWVNRIGGILFFAFIYLTSISIALFYLQKTGLIQSSSFNQSITWQYVQPLGPWVINGLGSVLPIFKNLFNQLQTFFDTVAAKAG
jgi:membrane protein required for colicin V production